MKKKEDITTHQNKNFESKKLSEDEQVFSRGSILFMNGEEARLSSIQIYYP